MAIPSSVSAAIWTAPPTWTTQLAHSVARDNALTGTGPTGTGGNENFLYDAVDHALGARSVATPVMYFPAGNYSLGAQTTFVNVDSTNLALTCSNVMTGRVSGFWLIAYAIDNTAHNGSGWVSTQMDGTTNDGGSTSSGIASSAAIQPNGWFTLPFFFSGLSVGSHTFKLVWRNDASAGMVQTIRGSATLGIRGEAWEI